MLNLFTDRGLTAIAARREIVQEKKTTNVRSAETELSGTLQRDQGEKSLQGNQKKKSSKKGQGDLVGGVVINGCRVCIVGVVAC